MPTDEAVVPETVERLARQVWETARLLPHSGLIVATGGNVSARDDATSWVAITPKSLPYERMNSQDVAIVEADGKQVRAHRAPSSEMPLHLAVFRELPSVKAIVHTHSPYAAAFSVVRRPIPLICNEGLGVGAAEVPVTRFAYPGTQAIGEAALEVLLARPGLRAFLLANHGVVALGSNPHDAFTLAAQVEWEARIFHHALAVGRPHELNAEQMADMLAVYDLDGSGGRS